VLALGADALVEPARVDLALRKGLQSVKINDAHIEVIVRQMLHKVEVKEIGDTTLRRGEQLERARILELSDRMVASKKKAVA
jgi:DNA-directed RNA polymerase subunit beta'